MTKKSKYHERCAKERNEELFDPRELIPFAQKKEQRKLFDPCKIRIHELNPFCAKERNKESY